MFELLFFFKTKCKGLKQKLSFLQFFFNVFLYSIFSRFYFFIYQSFDYVLVSINYNESV